MIVSIKILYSLSEKFMYSNMSAINENQRFFICYFIPVFRTFMEANNTEKGKKKKQLALSKGMYLRF